MAEDESGRGGLGWWLLAIPGAYFGFFALLLSEYLLFGSETIISSFPKWVQNALQMIYAPLLWLVETLGIV